MNKSWTNKRHNNSQILYIYIYIYIYIPWRDFTQASSVKQRLQHNQKSKKQKAKCILAQSTSKYTKKRQIHLKMVPNANYLTQTNEQSVYYPKLPPNATEFSSSVGLHNLFLRINGRCWPS